MIGVGAMAIRRGKKRGGKPSSPRDIGRPTPERLAKGDHLYVVVDNGAMHMRDAPIDRALSRSVITKEQHDALIKFRHHWYHAGMQGRIGSPELDKVFCESPGFSGMPATENQAFHRQRYRQGVQCLGLRLSNIVELVVCREHTLESAGKHLGWGNKAQAIASSTELLRLSGDMLHKIWG